MARFLHYLLPLLLIVFSLNSTTCYADKKSSAKKDLSGIKQKIKAIKKELDSKEAKHHDVTDALKKSETAISVANKKLRKIKQEEKQKKAQLAKLKKESLTIDQKLTNQQQQLSKLLYQQYSQGNQSYTKLILQNKHPNQISRDLKYQSYIAKAHAELISDMEESLAEIKAINAKTTDALDAVSKVAAKQEAERKELAKQKKEKATVLKKLSKQISKQRGQIKKLKRDEKRLANLVKKLAKISKKKPPKKTTKKGGKVVATNTTTPNKSFAGKRFSSLKGKLKLPVRGQLMNRFGKARRDSGLSWKGLFIRAKEGASVKSVASGQVVFAEWMRGFGNLIIVDHGSGYMSLYGNNQAVLKDVGQQVKGGDTIATVGNTGGNESNGLYYELRRKSIPFDPLKWSTVK